MVSVLVRSYGSNLGRILGAGADTVCNVFDIKCQNEQVVQLSITVASPTYRVIFIIITSRLYPTARHRATL